jgi:hypothetical protein
MSLRRRILVLGGIIGSVAALASNAQKIIDFLKSSGDLVAEYSISIALRLPQVRAFIGQKLLDRTYDGRACLSGADRVALTPNSPGADLLVAFRPKRANKCESLPAEWPTSYVILSWGGIRIGTLPYSFVGDFSPWGDFPNLSVQPYGPFLVVRPETAFNEANIFLVRNGIVTYVANVSQWYRGEGNEVDTNPELSYGDGCLRVSSSEPKVPKPICWDTPPDYSRESREEAEELVRNISFEVKVDVDLNNLPADPIDVSITPFSRVLVPGSCEHGPDITYWNSLRPAFRLTEDPKSDDSAVQSGEFSCYFEKDGQNHRIDIRLSMTGYSPP